MSSADPSSMLWPTYALRAWMTALLGQMERARDDLEARTEAHEKEITRLRAQQERCNTVITSLQEAVGSVDHVLRRTRDSDTLSRRGEAEDKMTNSGGEGDAEERPPPPRSRERRVGRRP